MGFSFREIDKTNEVEIDIVTKRCMDTVLETIPEFENDPQKAHTAFGNFTFDQMKQMIGGSLSSSNHRTLVVVDDETNQLIGHAIFSVKEDSDGRIYGSCYSRYVMPSFRRIGIASALLSAAEQWWTSKGAEYATAQTHIGNIALQKLFNNHGFSVSEEKTGKFPFFELKKQLQ
jgi:GNAT superfamily N-acetyltransferase